MLIAVVIADTPGMGIIFILLTLIVNFCLFSQNNIEGKEVEKLFLNLVNSDSFKSHLKELTKKPHVSGSLASK